MKNFKVETVKNGKKQVISLRANDKKSAQNLARQKTGATITKVAETQEVAVEMQFGAVAERVGSIFGFGNRVTIPNLVASVRQLAVMTNAGISIHDSIKEVANSTEEKRLKMIFESLNDDLNAGASLTEATEKFRADLGDLPIAMISLGESTGNMAEALQKLAMMLQEVWENQQKFKKAMRYPMILMTAMGIAFAILMMYVVPKFKEIFEELGANLPTPTIILLKCEYVLNNYGFVVLAIILGLVFGTKWLYKHNDLSLIHI